ncbi:RES family NAD+ phosphorylase, partial [Proteus mirabilis]
EDIIAYDIREYIEDKNYIYDSTGEETEFSSESYYIEREKVDTEYLDTIWDNFVSSLQTESRYINHTVKDTLDSIFSGIERMSAGGGQAIIVNSGPGTKIDSLYRARWSNNQATSEQMIVIPDKELGPPPYKFSGFNRMSARGISVFYGASSVSTAISEIRPPVGSEVISAKFRIIRPLKLLNLKALKTAWERGSMLDPDYIMKREQITFLRTLTNKIVNPVLPGEEEFSYIPTQVIAEYLANSPELNLDGILYPSVQQSASDTLSNFNVVLFHKASRVKYLELPAKEECYVNYWQQYDENDDELDICV